MFQKILIANRGEIACRIIRTAKRLGIHTVAVYSDIDQDAQHVRAADEAYCVGPAPSQESYLKSEAILEVARKCGAEAIHPGYGFLSENPHFALRCQEEDIVFIGPSVESIVQMGSKSQAKALLETADVPLVPGYHGEDQSSERFAKEAKKIGFPLLIKPAAGGGGKGMRVVHSLDELGSAIESAQREAILSFGDGTLLLEKYLRDPRHIEVQVFGDSYGNVVHLFERDCSLQRRHQKIIEEAPAISLSQEEREGLYKAALNVAKAVKYKGAGTVEFLLDQAGEGGRRPFYFMEMNTRLQVEHPVTEMITGIDLVEWQLRVAAGEPLPLKQEEISCHGHAIEARLCAEDPLNGFLPSIGHLDVCKFPSEDRDIRVDTGVQEGDEISMYYDPMVAKLIVWDETRSIAIQRLAKGIQKSLFLGLHTNKNFLRALLQTSQFEEGNFSTHFIEQQGEKLVALEKERPCPSHVYVFAALYLVLKRQQERDDFSPWSEAMGWRLNHSFSEQFQFQYQGKSITAFLKYEKDFIEVSIGEDGFKILTADQKGEVICLQDMHRSYKAQVLEMNHHLLIQEESGTYELVYCPPFESMSHETVEMGALMSPMPGKVTWIKVSLGQAVSKGQPLLAIEAMKMEHTLKAPYDGVVDTILCASGDIISEGMELLKLSPA